MFASSRWVRSLVLLAVVLVLAACGGGGGGGSADQPTTFTVQGKVSNGPLVGSNVQVFGANSGSVLGSATTGADGGYRVEVSGAGAYRLRATGGKMNGVDYTGVLEAYCATGSGCFVTPYTTVLLRLVDGHGFNPGDAAGHLANRLGFDGDPFVQEVPVHAFDLDAARVAISGGDALAAWVASVVAWVTTEGTQPPPGVGGVGEAPPGPPGPPGGPDPAPAPEPEPDPVPDPDPEPVVPVMYTVSAIAGGGGSISPSSQTVAQGATATFTVAPETGYSIDTVSGCNGSRDGNTYTTGAITEDCTVSASFASLLSAPGGLQAVASDGEVLLQWGSVPRADFYNLYYATNEGIQPENFGIWVSQHDGVMMKNVTSPYIVEGLENGTEYFFVVTATAGGQESGPSNEARAVPQEAATVSTKLNDTGITFCGAASSGNNHPCIGTEPWGQDAHYGRDAAALAGMLTKVGGGSAGFDFTKISNSGAELLASATLGGGPNDWACTRDNVTGLTWEVKVDNPLHLRHLGHTYTWYDPNSPDGNPGTPNGGVCTVSNCDTTGFVKAVNDGELCGTSDWRMPTWRELQGIVDYGWFNPAIDTGYFPNTPSSGFWSSSPSAGLNGAWDVSFFNGFAGYQHHRSNLLRVRLVRGGQ